MDDSSLIESLERPQLFLHEYLAVLVIIGFFAMLTLITIFRQESLPGDLQAEGHFLKPQIIEVFVQGAVELPGPYKVKTDSKVNQVIALAKPLNEADLMRFKPTSKVRPGQVIKVPFKSVKSRANDSKILKNGKGDKGNRR